MSAGSRSAHRPAATGADNLDQLPAIPIRLDGDERVRPRLHARLDSYFGRARSHLLARSATRGQLREVTEDDVTAALSQLSGHPRAGTFTAARWLFRFAKRRRLIFAEPTRRLHIDRAPTRARFPITDTQIATVQHTAVTPAQRLIVVLVAAHAARAGAIRSCPSTTSTWPDDTSPWPATCNGPASSCTARCSTGCSNRGRPSARASHQSRLSVSLTGDTPLFLQSLSVGAIVKTCGSRSLCCGVDGLAVGSFDELAGFEAGPGADEGDEVGCVDRPPAVLGGFDELERHRQSGGSRTRALGDLGAVPDGREGRLVTYLEPRS